MGVRPSLRRERVSGLVSYTSNEGGNKSPVPGVDPGSVRRDTDGSHPRSLQIPGQLRTDGDVETGREVGDREERERGNEDEGTEGFTSSSTLQ